MGGFASLSNSYAMYCTFMTLMGFGIGGNLPIDGSLFLEFIPKESQRLLTLLSLFWPVGTIFAGSFAWLILPTRCSPDGSYCNSTGMFGDKERWRYVLLASAAFTLSMLLVRVFFIQMFETPKWLISVGRRKEAAAVLNELAKRNGVAIHVTEEELPLVKKHKSEVDIEKSNIQNLENATGKYFNGLLKKVPDLKLGTLAEKYTFLFSKTLWL